MKTFINIHIHLPRTVKLLRFDATYKLTRQPITTSWILARKIQNPTPEDVGLQHKPYLPQSSLRITCYQFVPWVVQANLSYLVSRPAYHCGERQHFYLSMLFAMPVSFKKVIIGHKVLLFSRIKTIWDSWRIFPNSFNMQKCILRHIFPTCPICTSFG